LAVAQLDHALATTTGVHIPRLDDEGVGRGVGAAKLVGEVAVVDDIGHARRLIGQVTGVLQQQHAVSPGLAGNRDGIPTGCEVRHREVARAFDGGPIGPDVSADQVVGVVRHVEEGEAGPGIAATAGGVDGRISFAGLDISDGDIPAGTIRQGRVASGRTTRAVVFIVTNRKQHAVSEGIDSRQAKNPQAGINATATGDVHPVEQVGRAVIVALSAEKRQANHRRAAVQTPAVTAFPVGRTDVHLVWSVKITGLPSLVVREPTDRDRNGAPLQVAEVAGRVGGRTRHQFRGARIELRAAIVTAEHVVPLSRGYSVQLHVGGGVEIRRGVIPCLAVLVNGCEHKTIIRGRRPGLRGGDVGPATRVAFAQRIAIRTQMLHRGHRIPRTQQEIKCSRLIPRESKPAGGLATDVRDDVAGDTTETATVPNNLLRSALDRLNDIRRIAHAIRGDASVEIGRQHFFVRERSRAGAGNRGATTHRRIAGRSRGRPVIGVSRRDGMTRVRNIGVVCDGAQPDINRFREVGAGLGGGQHLPTVRASGIRGPTRRKVRRVRGLEVGGDAIPLALQPQPDIRIRAIPDFSGIATVFLHPTRHVICADRRVQEADALDLAIPS